jgi:hypothetical protein
MNLTLDQIAAYLPRPTEHNQEAYALRFLLDQDPVDDTIYAEYLERRATLRMTFRATSSPFGRARVWLVRQLVPMTVSDVLMFSKIIAELAQEGGRDVVLSEACATLFAKYQIKVDAKSAPKPKVRQPRS